MWETKLNSIVTAAGFSTGLFGELASNGRQRLSQALQKDAAGKGQAQEGEEGQERQEGGPRAQGGQEGEEEREEEAGQEAQGCTVQQLKQ